MKRKIFLTSFLLVIFLALRAQNVFDPSDPIIRYDASQPLGSQKNPNPAISGLQKWVCVATNGVSTGTGSFDASSFKAYYAKIGSKAYAFRLKFPKSYNNPDSAKKKYPVMLFFNGAGEVGCATNGGIYNNEKHLLLGGNVFRARVDNNQFDGFLLYPQFVPGDNSCWGNWPTNSAAYYQPIISIIDSLIKYTRVDIDRVFVDGLSAGGNAVWKIAEFFPQRIAAIAPSSSAGMSLNFPAFVHIPMWFATGGKDTNPSPGAAQRTLNSAKNIGANIRYTLFADYGHAIWNLHWHEPDFVPFMNSAHKANPLVFFQHDEFCPDSVINAKIGVTGGFYAYEWQRNGVTIASVANGVVSVLNTSIVSLFTQNEITVKALGTYRVRFKRTASSAWSAFSPIPAVIKAKAVTQTDPIRIDGVHSRVLPALDGSTTVPLILQEGFVNYKWYNATTNAIVSTAQSYVAGIGRYKATYSEPYGCGSSFSPIFAVVDANGLPKPDPAKALNAVPLSQTEVQLDWQDNTAAVTNETGFEIYRALQPRGPYQFVALTAANAKSYKDKNLTPNTTYYYVVRAVCNTGAAVASNEAAVKTNVDDVLPAAPKNLQYRGSTKSSVSLRWSAATDNIGVKRYDVYGNGVLLYSTTNTFITITNLDSLTSYAFSVKAVDEADNASPASNQIAAYTHRQGFNYKYFNGTWTKLPDFKALTPARTGVTDTISLNNGIRTQSDRYGFLWEASIYIPVTATYTFETLSDEGSKLFIDAAYSATAVPLINNDGVHTAKSVTATVNLTEGYHKIALAYFEATSTETIQLYWSNNAGTSRERIPKNFFAYENINLPGPPLAPSSLKAVPAAYNKIKLTWIDNSNNERGFEIERATSPNGPFSPIGTTDANVKTFVDSTLSAVSTYYYRVRAVSATGESAYITASASTPTQSAPTVPLAPSDLQVQAATDDFVSMSWNDNSTNESNFQVWRSDGNNTSFRLIATLRANNNAYTDATVVPFTRYYYRIVAINSSGSSLPSNTVQVNAGNNLPVISTLNDLFVKTDATVIANFTVTDDPGDVVIVSVRDRPSFIKLDSLGASKYRITLKPTIDNIGWYTITVAAKDDKGGVSTKTLLVTVADKNTRNVFVNFGNKLDKAPKPWNNWLDKLAANSSILNLKDETNTATTFGITSINAWASVTNLGHRTGNNTGVLPDTVLQSGVADTNRTHQLSFSGLNRAMKYNLVFVGSQNEGSDATAQYAANNQKDTLNARYNTNKTANLNGLVPDASGKIVVTITKLGKSVSTYLNGIIIEEYAPTIPLLNPVNLFAETIDRTSVNVSWSDRSNNENVGDGFELQIARDSLFTNSLRRITLPGNTSTYKATNLSSNAKYWFRVRAKTGTTFSAYSNRGAAITPESIVYVNFNYTVPSSGSPWNNTFAPPTSNSTFTDLLDQSGTNTGIGLKIEQIFNGEFNAGMNTGNNSGVVPDNVLMSNYWLDNTQTSKLRVMGLNHTMRYRFGFIGSSGPAGWYKGNYTATYNINDRTVYLNSWENTSKIVYIDDVNPDENGEVMLNFSTTAAASYGFNAGVIIEQYNDSLFTYQSDPGSDSIINDTLTEVPPIFEGVHARMYPNPFKENITIQFNNSASSNKISADVFDMSGRLIVRKYYSNIAAGPQTLQLPVVSTSGNKGIFVVLLNINGKTVATRKMMRGIR